MSNTKHYVDEKGNVYGYLADGSQDHLIGNKTRIDDAQLEEIYKARQQKFNAYIETYGHPPASLEDY